MLLSLFFLRILHKVLKNFFQSERNLPVRYIIWMFYYLLQVLCRAEKIFSPQIILALNVLFVFLISSMSYYGSMKKHCLFSLLICSVWMLTEIIVVTILGILGLDGAELQVAGSAISKMIMFFLSAFPEQLLKQKKNWNLPFYFYLVMILVPAGSIYIIHNVFMIANRDKVYSLFAVITGILLLLMNYVIFDIYEWIRQSAELKEKNLLYEQQLELCRQQAEERETRNLEIRKLRHDMKNHMVCLFSMVQSADIEMASLYINELLKKNEEYHLEEISRSGNIVIDSLINYKYTQARTERINFDAYVFIPTKLPFQSAHLTIIFGNLLENALEACREMKGGERYIELEVLYGKEILTIRINNTFEGERRRNRNGCFLTTKSNANNHGLGLSSVEKAVEAYQGQILTKCANGIFQVTVVLYGANV